jgi:hypothetical protein
VRADANHNKPFDALDTLLVALWIGQRFRIDGASLLDLSRSPAVDEYGLAAPRYGDPLAELDWVQVDLDGGKRSHVSARVHAGDQWPQSEGAADRHIARRGDIQEISPYRLWPSRANDLAIAV